MTGIVSHAATMYTRATLNTLRRFISSKNSRIGQPNLMNGDSIRAARGIAMSLLL